MGFNHLPNEFYPTPPELVVKMINHKFIKEKFETILEPSAGKGDLIDFLFLAKDYLNEGGYCRAIYDKDFSMPYETVIDEYEGQQEYEAVYNNRENYILDVGQRMLLTDGG